MRCLLLSAYDAPSHRYWREGLIAAFPEWQWTCLTEPPRFFNWRIRGNALSLAEKINGLGQSFDCIIATSMTDLAGIKAFCPQLASVPTLLYFHENQFCYPANEVQRNRLEPAMMTLFSAHAADKLVFNSRYNRNTFMAGARALLGKLPDAVPAGLVESLINKTSVLPVPLRDEAFRLAAKRNDSKPGRRTFIWNHRWEHDKGPEGLLAAVRLLLAQTQNFTLHVVGQQFRQRPACFDALKTLLETSGTLGRWGFIESRAEYNQLLVESDAVISTALHDFQGLAVLEAVAAGCYPLVPDRLVYPEWFPVCYAAATPIQEVEALVQAMSAIIDRGPEAAPPVNFLRWCELGQKYAALARPM
ncbi:tRNA-queuosine alpha-mannosyltransferase domain-containing protein [Simiduia agarivorans]|uniref:tRNA-queuosine alpha-mannosyltransferase n=1 Tax=Simiduia agarivorans (strain DSM 21679 / JCM 13881 / BCRC 17597 / SA1) TaxID=1117647 RepID=K4KH09_SIMAS|nr:DUF3524 domain-containing protein [Simiduia agarivorans]AFU97495.1 group 1 glycosyl transferase [Simiduia agarivorans SA1 = DSM 21679]